MRPEQSASLSDADVGVLDALGWIRPECQGRLGRKEVRATTESILDSTALDPMAQRRGIPTERTNYPKRALPEAGTRMTRTSPCRYLIILGSQLIFIRSMTKTSVSLAAMPGPGDCPP